MAQTLSNMLPLGTIAPDFNLPATNFDGNFTFNNCEGAKGTLVIFMCNHCPFVLHVMDEIIRIANDYQVQGLGIVAISSNDIEKYPQDNPENMSKFAFENKMNFPYLFDESQEVAKNYDAACTPDFYLFDQQSKLVYRGQLDDSRPNNGIVVSGSDLRSAIEGVINNKTINENQKPSIGCNIKWKNN